MRGKSLITTLLLCVFFEYANSQTRLNCGAVDLQISNFVLDTSKLYTKIWAEQYGLEPLSKSKSSFEIRFHTNSPLEMGPIFIIKCEGDEIKAYSYNYWMGPPKPGGQLAGSYRTDPKISMYLYKREFQLKPESNWNKILTQLKDLHLFELPSDQQLSNLAAKNKQKLVSGGGGVTNILEIKVNNLYRSVQYKTAYYMSRDDNPPQTTVKEAYWFVQIVDFLSSEIYNK